MVVKIPNKKDEEKEMKAKTKAKYVSLGTLRKMDEKGLEELKAGLDKEIEAEIKASDDPIEKSVSRKKTSNIMIKIERRWSPVVKGEEGVDIKDLKKLLG